MAEDRPTLNGEPLAAPKVEAKIDDDILRRMNHVEWLNDFAKVLGMQRPGGPPQTPMRQGAIARLQLAAQYIELLKKDLWQATHGDDRIEDIPEGR